MVQAGHPVPAFTILVEGRPRARLRFNDLPGDLTPYSFVLNYPQDQHERLLIERLASRGITVERNTEFMEVTQDDQGIRARVRRSDGSETSCTAAYLAGCDGPRSSVREALGIGFPGGTYPARKSFLAIADALSRDGIVVLRLNDRGAAKASGRKQLSTVQQLADDLVAGVAFRKTWPEVNRTEPPFQNDVITTSASRRP